LDDRTEVTPGFKFNEWELRGVPLRLEIGPKDVEKGSVMAARRDIPGKAGKSILLQENLAPQVQAMLDTIQASMLQRATDFRDANIHNANTYDELKEIIQNGWAESWWCGSADARLRLKRKRKRQHAACHSTSRKPKKESVCIAALKQSKKSISQKRINSGTAAEREN
jgi:prolyl-tRNA synthetase